MTVGGRTQPKYAKARGARRRAARPKGLALLTASSFLRYDQTIDLHLLSVQVLKQRVGAYIPSSFLRYDQTIDLHLLSVQVLKQRVGAYIRILIRDVGLPPQCASTVSRGRRGAYIARHTHLFAVLLVHRAVSRLSFHRSLRLGKGRSAKKARAKVAQQETKRATSAGCAAAAHLFPLLRTQLLHHLLAREQQLLLLLGRGGSPHRRHEGERLCHDTASEVWLGGASPRRGWRRTLHGGISLCCPPTQYHFIMSERSLPS